MKNSGQAKGSHTFTGSPALKLGAPSVVALLVAAAIAAPGGAFAQNASANSNDQNSGDQLQEVVVTATRRAENIQSVPVTVTAFSQQQMDVQGVKQIDDIARLAPNVQFSRGGGFGSDLSNEISIRGISNISGDATTGIYIDDTPIQVGATIASGNFATNAYPQLFDLQRVEVLAGPQGTLFGSGSEGGTVRFITPPPNMDKSSVYVRSEASTTEYGAPSYEVGIAGGAPIIPDVLGFHASVWTRHDGGYVDAVNYYTGQVTAPDNNWQDSASGRFALGWQPIEGLMITPSVFFQRIKDNGTSAFQLHGDGLTGSVAPGLAPDLPVFQQPYGNVADGDYVDIHHTPQWANQTMALPALKIDYSFNNMELISNTSYYSRMQDGVTDFGWLEAGNWAGLLFPSDPNSVNPGYDSQSNSYFTQEVRLQSTDADSRLKWVVGAYYSRGRTRTDRSVYDPELGTLIGEGPFGGGCTTPTSCIASVFGPTPLVDGLYSFVGDTTLTEYQRALFGQVDYRIFGGLIGTVGWRYSRFGNEWLNEQGGPVTGVAWPNYEAGNSDASASTPKFMLSYKTDHTLTYASATKGFRDGGVNAALTNVACQGPLHALGLNAAPQSYNPDSIWSYELGSKFTTDEGKLVIDASVFQYNWKNMITNIDLTQCTLSFTANIGSAQGRGYDLAVQYRPLRSLVLGMNSGYTYLKSTQTVTSGGAQNFSTNGDTIYGGVTINGSAQYDFTAFNRPSYLHVDYNYTGPPAVNFNPVDAGYVSYDEFRSPGYSTTDLRLGMMFGGWDVSLFANNLFNAQPILDEERTTIALFVPSDLLTATTIRPRTAGITATFRL